MKTERKPGVMSDIVKHGPSRNRLTTFKTRTKIKIVIRTAQTRETLLHMYSENLFVDEEFSWFYFYGNNRS